MILSFIESPSGGDKLQKTPRSSDLADLAISSTYYIMMKYQRMFCTNVPTY